MGSSDPFFTISRVVNEEKVKVYESIVCKKTIYPNWEVQTLSIASISNGNLSTPIELEVFDWQSNGKHQYMGSKSFVYCLIKYSFKDYFG